MSEQTNRIPGDILVPTPTLSTINIVFAQDPNTPDLTFVEVEDENGKSIVAGDWNLLYRPGYISLELQVPTNSILSRCRQCGGTLEFPADRCSDHQQGTII